MDDLSGQCLKGYELREKIGAGGFGAVYRAFQQVVEREVAIKVILPEYANQPDFIRRFETEAQLVARLEHLHIVPLYDYWRDPDGAYLVMRYFRRGSLRGALDGGAQYQTGQIVRFADQIAAALEVAHRNGVIHRDMKPDNILLDDDNNAYLADFGIAKTTKDTDEDEGITGSPNYISPEQITGADISPQTDLYSFGILLYELLAGRPPFSAPNLGALLMSHINEPIPNLTTFRPDLPYGVDGVFQQAMAKTPEKRFANALELAAALRGVLLGGTATSGTPTIILTEVKNPYKGLRPFEEADAADFFGRTVLTEQLLDRLREDTPTAEFLAVVGPSGSGKSSVVKAGLVPALRQGALTGSEKWFYAEMLPGAQPFQKLEAALLSVAVNQPENLRDLLYQDRLGLLRAVNSILPNPNDTLFLVIDQFEEVFTLATDDTETLRFLNLLLAAVNDPSSRVRIVITLRADFYDRPLLYPAFATLMRARTEVVLPLTADELEQAITGPAARVGVEVDANLVATIISDVSEEPGVLPLLQYVLTEVFERRAGLALKLETYQDIGGVIGALARRAEELYNEMDAASQDMVRQLFLRLVTLGEGAEDTRRRVSWQELTSITDTANRRILRETMQTVLDTFSKYRLLTADRDPVTRQPTVEVAHEALIREWQRLREWLDQSRADVRLQRLLGAAAQEWSKARREISFLLTGARLAQYEEWIQTTDLVLTHEERAYVEASLAQREVQRQAEAARQRHEAELERRAKQRLRAIAVVLTIATVVALVLTVYAFTQREEARRARDAAERNAAEMLSLALSEQAENLAPTDPVLAIALAVQANHIDAPPGAAQRALAEIAYAPGLRAELPASAGQITGVAIGPDGKTAITASFDSFINVWNLETQQIMRTLDNQNQPVTCLALSPDGQTALSGSLNGTVTYWDVTIGQPINTLSGHTGAVNAVAFSLDGKQALSGGADSTLIQWDLAEGTAVQTLTGHTEGLTDVAFSPDGQLAVSSSNDNSIIVWKLATGKSQRRMPGQTDILSVAFSPDGSHVLSSSRAGQLTLWDIVRDAGDRDFGGSSATTHSLPANRVVFTPDGQRVISVSDDMSLIIWDVPTGMPLQRLSGHTDKVRTVAVDPSGNVVLSGANNGQLLLWDIVDRGLIQTINSAASGQIVGITSVAFSPIGETLLSGFDDGRLELWDEPTSALIRSFGDPAHSGKINVVAFSPDGKYALSGGDDQQLILWNVETGALERSFGPDGLAHTKRVTSAAFSPDGKLLASGSEDASAILWDVQTGALIRALGSGGDGHQRGILALAFSPDGQTILTGSADNTLMLWEANTGKRLQTLTGHARRVLSVAFSPDGKTAVSGSLDGTLIVWDVSTGQKIQQFTGHEGGVATLAMNPNGQTLISGSSDNHVVVWDVRTGEIVNHFAGHTDDVTGVAFSADGRMALSGSTDGTLRLWRTLPPDELIAWTRQNRLVRPLTCAEQALYRIQGACEEVEATPEATSSGS